ncbi:MAG TPA: hypothetical protein VG347_16200 [Verrucomicrobiae bacterium]|nr:hypothetical protein [Verrucomicrobiae bacterium]
MKPLKIIIRLIVVLLLVAFSGVIFPAWGMDCVSLPTVFKGNEFQAAPLRVLAEFAIGFIFPLGALALFASFLPTRVLRYACAAGIVFCLVVFLGSVLPHSWKTKEGLSPFYLDLWEAAQKTANQESNYERIEFDNKNKNEIIFYVNGGGLSFANILFLLMFCTPSAAFGVEILLRKKFDSSALAGK